MGEKLEQIALVDFFSRCLIRGLIGPHRGYVATRNPFNAQGEFNAWLIPMNSKLLPDCVDLNLRAVD